MIGSDIFEYQKVIDQICGLDWKSLDGGDMAAVAWAYYFFSIQFREHLKVARNLFPDDEKLLRLEEEECETDNLSPWPGVAVRGEKMNHDEYMRRTLALDAIKPASAQDFKIAGQSYLMMSRALDPAIRAASIASYEDGGLEKVFTAMLGCSSWEGKLLHSFQHFLVEHVRFDSDPEQGHGALSRHMTVDDQILPLWQGFRQLLVTCVPKLVRDTDHATAGIHEFNGGFAVFPVGSERLGSNATKLDTLGVERTCDNPVCHP